MKEILKAAGTFLLGAAVIFVLTVGAYFLAGFLFPEETISEMNLMMQWLVGFIAVIVSWIVLWACWKVGQATVEILKASDIL